MYGRNKTNCIFSKCKQSWIHLSKRNVELNKIQLYAVYITSSKAKWQGKVENEYLKDAQENGKLGHWNRDER